MASRLVLKYGLVSPQDRLSNSADALLVSEPTTGSKSRTKGSLYVIVTAGDASGRVADACQLVADTIRREYYYDESAGIAIVLEKALRTASRRLRQAREGDTLASGALGVALAVVRANELYVATTGEADAYLIRSARLLMPERAAASGLPAPDPFRVDVWRGEFAVGDSLVLCSRNLVDVVGTEELKNSVVTMHPQSAVEHLHHLFVAAGGSGSDAVLAIEASELALTRAERRLVPVAPSQPLAGAPARSPIPLADQVAGAASAMHGGASAVRGAMRENLRHAVDRLVELLPQRATPRRRVTAATSRRETQRRTALAVLAFLGVIGFMGLALWWWSGLQASEHPGPGVAEGEAAYNDAAAKISQVYDLDLLHSQVDVALSQLRDAWASLARAEAAGVDATAIGQQRARAAQGLDVLYGTHRVSTSQVWVAPTGSEVYALVRGPDGAAYLIVDQSVVRVDPASGASATIVQPGDGTGAGIGAARLLSVGGPDLLIVDASGRLWRWRPSDSEGGGTLGAIRVGGDQAWGNDVVDVSTFVTNPDQGLYRVYVPFPSLSQILRYDPIADGSGFSPPAPYFVNRDDNVPRYRQLYIDGDVYTLLPDGLQRFYSGNRTSFSLDDPPDNGDLRPGHEYGRMIGTGSRGVGRLLLWDRTWSRVVVYDKANGSWLEQFVAAPGERALDDVRGMFLLDRGATQAPLLLWAGPAGLYATALVDTSAEPAATPTPAPAASDQASAPPEGPTPEPTHRPRRTPRVTATP
jgi:serine/threonine protein phosphatase PrpC